MRNKINYLLFLIIICLVMFYLETKNLVFVVLSILSLLGYLYTLRINNDQKRKHSYVYYLGLLISIGICHLYVLTHMYSFVVLGLLLFLTITYLGNNEDNLESIKELSAKKA